MPQKLTPEAFDSLFQAPKNDEKLGDNVAKLENDLAMEREARSEERFIWIATVAVLGDFIGYGLIHDFLAFVPIFLLELIILAIVAKRLGVDWAVQLLGWLMYQMSRKMAPPPEGNAKTKDDSAPPPAG